MTTEVATKPTWFDAVKRYALLAYGAGGSALALGLMVLGSILVGISLPVLLSGFGLLDIAPGMGTAALLTSALILGVAGGFCLGVASESPLGRGRRLQGFKIWEVGIGRTLAVLLVGFGFLALYRFLFSVIGEVPTPLYKGVEAVRAVGAAAVVAMPLIGVPLSLLIRAAPTSRVWVTRLDQPAMFMVWLVAALMSIA